MAKVGVHIMIKRSRAMSEAPTTTTAAPTTTTAAPTTTAAAPTTTSYCDAGLVRPAASMSVLILGAVDIYGYVLADVQYELEEMQAFARVDTWDESEKFPSLSYLQNYEALLVYNVFPFYSPDTLGDLLAEYWDGGGAVVLAEFANGINGLGVPGFTLQGRFGNAANGYTLIDSSAGGDIYESDSLGTVLEPLSPLMTGINTLDAIAATESYGRVINGGKVVATWKNTGFPLIVRGARAGRPLVTLNTCPFLMTGDVGPFLRNALFYSMCTAG